LTKRNSATMGVLHFVLPAKDDPAPRFAPERTGKHKCTLCLKEIGAEGVLRERLHLRRLRSPGSSPVEREGLNIDEENR